MIKYPLKLLKISTVRDSGILLSSAFSSSVLGFLLTIILARNFTTSEFGLFFTGLNFSQIIINSSDLGLPSSTVNFTALENKIERFKLLKSIFISRVITALLVGILIFLFSEQISETVLRNNSIVNIIKLSALGIPFYIFITWAQIFFQAQKKFFRAAILITSINVLRIATVLLLIVAGLFTLQKAYLAVQVVLVFISIATLVLLKTDFLEISISYEDFKKIFKFSIPIGLSLAMVSIYSRVDQLFVFNILGQDQAGVYAVSSRMAYVLIYVSYALSGAVSPRFAALNIREFRAYFRKTLIGASVLCLLILLGVIFTPEVIPLLFGDSFIGSVLPFQILSIGTVFFLFTSLFNNAILYQFKKNKFFTIISMISLFSIVGLLEILIPKYNIVGAAISVSLVYALQLVISLLYYLKLSSHFIKLNTLSQDVGTELKSLE